MNLCRPLSLAGKHPGSRELGALIGRPHSRVAGRPLGRDPSHRKWGAWRKHGVNDLNDFFAIVSSNLAVHYSPAAINLFLSSTRRARKRLFVRDTVARSTNRAATRVEGGGGGSERGTARRGSNCAHVAVHKRRFARKSVAR